jgi:FkbM family methyltransferase
MNITKIFPDRVNLKFYNHIFETPTSPDNLNMIIDFFKILYQGKISIISIEENNVMINIKNLNLTLKAPLSLLAPAISNMLSKKYYETWYWDVDVKDKVVVDVGAYIGDSALFFASRGAKIVYAYEPSKRLYEIAMENCSNYNNIIAYKTIAYSHRGKIKFFENKDVPWMSSIAANNSNGIEIEAITLDEISKSIKLKKIDLIKIDAEGSEYEILKGSEYTLKLTKYLKSKLAQI